MDIRTALGAAFYAGVAAMAMARPGVVPGIFGGTAPTPTSRTEIRAVYGGLPATMATLIVLESREAERPMTLAMGALSGGMALGRVVGVRIEREASLVTKAFIAAEVVAAMALTSAAVRRPSRTEA